MEMYPNGKFTSSKRNFFYNYVVETILKNWTQNHLIVDPLIVLESLVVFDVWLLIKAHWIMRKIVQILFPTLKMVLVMMLGAGLLLAYAVAQSGIRLDPKVVHCKNDNLVISNYLEINDNFTSDPVSLRKDLLKMKKEAMNLEKSLYRMVIFCFYHFLWWWMICSSWVLVIALFLLIALTFKKFAQSPKKSR